MFLANQILAITCRMCWPIRFWRLSCHDVSARFRRVHTCTGACDFSPVHVNICPSMHRVHTCKYFSIFSTKTIKCDPLSQRHSKYCNANIYYIRDFPCVWHKSLLFNKVWKCNNFCFGPVSALTCELQNSRRKDIHCKLCQFKTGGRYTPWT